MLFNFLQRIKDLFRGASFGSVGRDNRWPGVRRLYLKDHPVCEITGSKKRLIVHHKKPVHLFPELELDPTNFITLSEDVFGSNAHLIFGHLGNYQSFNENIDEDAKIWREKLLNRP